MGIIPVKIISKLSHSHLTPVFGRANAPNWNRRLGECFVRVPNINCWGSIILYHGRLEHAGYPLKWGKKQQEKSHPENEIVKMWKSLLPFWQKIDLNMCHRACESSRFHIIQKVWDHFVSNGFFHIKTLGSKWFM